MHCLTGAFSARKLHCLRDRDIIDSNLDDMGGVVGEEVGSRWVPVCHKSSFIKKNTHHNTKLMLTISNALSHGSLESSIGIMPFRTLMASAGVRVEEAFDMVRY